MRADLWQFFTLEYDVKYTPEPTALKDYLMSLTDIEELRQTLRRTAIALQAGSKYYRASSNDPANPNEMRQPFWMRGNPHGQPLSRPNFAGDRVVCAAENESTAVAEILRLSPEDFNFHTSSIQADKIVTVAELCLRRVVEAFDLSSDNDECYLNINARMSARVDSLEKIPDYYVTAAICQIARQAGAEAVLYRSSWNPAARNIAIFSQEAFDIESPVLKRITLKAGLR